MEAKTQSGAENSELPVRPRLSEFVQGLRNFVQRHADTIASGKVTFGLGLAAVLAAIATYLSISDFSPFETSPQLVLGFLLLDLILLLALATLVAWRLVALWMARRSGTAGSRLHVRLVILFGLVAIIPTIIMAVYSTLTINLGFQAWFGDRVAQVVSASVSVAEAYVEEHKMMIRAEILAMGNDINRSLPLYYQDRGAFSELVNQQAQLRSLADAYVITGTGEVLAKSGMSFAGSFTPPSKETVASAANGDVVILASERDAQVRALLKLDRFLDGYLYVSRFVDPRVINTAMQARRAASDYAALEGQRGGIQIAFAMIYLALAMLVLLAAIAVGFWLANRLVEPISRLAVASERLRDGDLSARVDDTQENDEIGALSRAFNRMAGQLEGQRSELLGANLQLDRRRRFTEAVLGGVTSGVIGLDSDGKVNLANGAAMNLLDSRGEELAGLSLEAVVPEMQPLLLDARARPGRVIEGEISLGSGDTARNLLVRVATVGDAEREGVSAPSAEAGRAGFVVTFDDISALVSAQRTAAWADVARRIAHEIKNPLTPIQLSAERLRRKYSHEIVTDPEIFERCTETIIRQVREIGRMIDEFSSFARMPAPVLRQENLNEIARQAVFQQQLTAPAISISVLHPEQPLRIYCDRAQISQALVNIIKNATEAIETRKQMDGVEGHIEVRITVDKADRILLSVLDNGCGLPREIRRRLTEPYVTTREKGTGLGLAIVRKIAEDHGARISIQDLAESQHAQNPGFGDTGAVVQIIFPAQIRDDPSHVANGRESAMSAISDENNTDANPIFHKGA
ncbi:MAG: two-component system, NtrC family, nitrogen regulation sensor histidine kinase NtrY [Alphaproteobacteria bacterium]|nr:two-component system, NtrC family, nitrogen regulation sensor histidine kinase NtrY [Alphaproteobacteria bacterium]